MSAGELLQGLADPTRTPFALWAPQLSEALAAYNAPTPGPELSWLSWALQVSALPEMVELGCPDPRGFSGWQNWAVALNQVIS